MSKAIYFVMDPIENINVKKDTTLAFLYEGFKRGYECFVFQSEQLWLEQMGDRQKVFALVRQLTFSDSIERYELGESHKVLLNDQANPASMVFMRQDPPVTIEYITTTFILDILERDGVLVVNHPGQVRSANEKLTAVQFEFAPKTVVSSQKFVFHDFFAQQKDIVIKPLDGMGGQGVFRIRGDDQNLDSVVETLTQNGRVQIMAQEYIAEIVEGDKRILMIHGEPIPYALARVPQDGALRGNLAAGGRGVGVALGEMDRRICAKVGPWLKQHQIYFAGLDVIGDCLTEVNVTSPTCVRELDSIYNLNISGQLFDSLEKILRPTR